MRTWARPQTVLFLSCFKSHLPLCRHMRTWPSAKNVLLLSCFKSHVPLCRPKTATVLLLSFLGTSIAALLDDVTSHSSYNKEDGERLLGYWSNPINWVPTPSCCKFWVPNIPIPSCEFKRQTSSWLHSYKTRCCPANLCRYCHPFKKSRKLSTVIILF